MVCLSSFEAVHYRGIDGLSLPRLSRANLITGVNGVGKTALIEAIWLFMGRYSPMLLWNGNVHRSGNVVLDPITKLAGSVLELRGTEGGSEHEWKATFDHVSGTAQVVIENPAQPSTQLPVAGRVNIFLDGELAKGSIPGIHATPWGVVTHENPVLPPPRPNCVIESTQLQLASPGGYMQRYSDLVREGRKQELTSAINLVLPKITDVEILTGQTGESYVSAVTESGNLLPLSDLGGGVVRLFRLFLNFFASRNGILLADEIENGIHYSVLGDVWRHTRTWMRDWNVQFVATTHSAECIDAAMEAFADNPEDLAIHKLFENEESGKIGAATFTGEALEGAREMNWEIR